MNFILKSLQGLAITAVLMGSLTSCNKDDDNLEPSKNVSEETFESLWNELDQHYALFTVRNIDWNELYKTYRPKVTAQTNDEDLWIVLTSMLANLEDGHTMLADTVSKTVFDSGDPSGIITERTESEFSLELLNEKYLDDAEYAYYHEDEDGNPEEFLIAATVHNTNIGYIYFNNVTDSVAYYMEEVVMAMSDCPAIIIDLRQNGGGMDDAGAQIAGLFADSEKLIYTVQTRNGAGHNDFSEKKNYYSQKRGASQYVKPVVILTDNFTVSAAEVMMIHFKSFNHVTQIGDVTSGDFSDLSDVKTLPNGWRYTYSYMMYLLPDGTSLDGVGHKPDIEVRNSAADIKAGTDKVMEKTLSYLFEKYNIN